MKQIFSLILGVGLDDKRMWHSLCKNEVGSGPGSKLLTKSSLWRGGTKMFQKLHQVNIFEANLHFAHAFVSYGIKQS